MEEENVAAKTEKKYTGIKLALFMYQLAAMLIMLAGVALTAAADMIATAVRLSVVDMAACYEFFCAVFNMAFRRSLLLASVLGNHPVSLATIVFLIAAVISGIMDRSSRELMRIIMIH